MFAGLYVVLWAKNREDKMFAELALPSFFFETEAKDLPHRLIKKKRIAQLINEKPGENRYKPTTCGLLTQHATHKHMIASQPYPTPNVHQPPHCYITKTPERE